MKLSARNVFEGTVVDVAKGAVAARVTVDIGGGRRITSTITVEAAEELALEAGKKVSAIVKASDVILAAED